MILIPITCRVASRFAAPCAPAAWICVVLVVAACAPCLLAQSGGRVQVVEQEAENAMRNHDFAGALADYNRALAIAPRNANGEMGLARAYRAVHNYDEAKLILDRAVQAHPKNAAILAELGNLEIELQTYEPASRHLAAALALKPDDTASRVWLAVTYKSMGDAPRALDQLAKILAREPKNALAYYERAQIYADQNQDRKALQDAQKAVELQPNAPGRVLLAKILLRPPADRDAKETSKRCAQAAEALEPLIGTAAQASDSPGSTSTESESAQKESADSGTLFLLARAYQCSSENAKAQQARDEFEAASTKERTAKENQTGAKQLVQQANDAAMKNDFRGALELLQQALEKDASYAPAYSQLAKLYYSAGDMAKASDAIEKALALDVYQPDFLYVRGRILEKQGKLDEALAAFERTTLVNPKESDAYFEMGAIYAQRNDRARALAAYKRAVELSPEDADYRRALASLK